MPAQTASTSDSLRSQLLAVGATLNHAHHTLVTLAARFEASDEWIWAGSPTAAHWIADRLDICVATAHEWIRIGKVLRRVPLIDAAMAAQTISFSKARVLTRIATIESEAQLLEIAARTPAGQLGCALAAWSSRNEDREIRRRRHHRDRGLRFRVEPDGMVVGSLRLAPEQAAVLRAAVDAAVMGSTTGRGNHTTAAGSDRWPSLAQQRADSLVNLVSGGGADVAAEVVMHLRGDGCTFDDGTPVADSVVERAVSEGFVRALIHDAHGRPINASSRRRHPTERQKRLVKERDRCGIDCGSTELLEYDHVPEFSVSGRTVIDELRLRCAPCHHRRHRRM